MDEWRCLSDREGEKKERRRRGKWEYLIAGCTAIQEASNVSEKHISDLLSNGKPAGSSCCLPAGQPHKDMVGSAPG